VLVMSSVRDRLRLVKASHCNLPRAFFSTQKSQNITYPVFWYRDNAKSVFFGFPPVGGNSTRSEAFTSRRREGARAGGRC